MHAVTPGTIVAGKYHVEQLLGRGGMGFVVAATHKELMDRVAIKFLQPELASSAEIVSRFVTEARAARRIGSEHVAKVLDVGTDPTLNAPYMVMEFLDGEDLAALLQRSGPQSLSLAIDLILQACEALAEAHALGIVHRDLKPANLFLTRRADGSPCIKVLDFGICKLNASQDGVQLTAAGKVMGTVLYASPEQLISSRNVGPRSDLWSLGVVLFQLLTGHCPFIGQAIGEIVAQVLHNDPPDVRMLRPDIPEAVSRTLFECMTRDLNRRIPNVQALARQLVPFGGASARLSAERIAGIAIRDTPERGSTVPSTDLPKLGDVPPRLASSTAGISQRAALGVATSHPSGSATPRSRTRAWLGALGLALVSVIVAIALTYGGAFRQTRHPDDIAPATSISSHDEIVRKPPPPPSWPVPAVANPVPVAEASTTTTPVVAPLTSTTTSASNSAPTANTRPRADKAVAPRPIVQPPSDDLFGNRH